MIKLFADINCPFCFAQHERLTDSGVIDQVEWCYVEHAPELDSSSNSESQLDLLAEEFRLLTLRTEGLQANKPDFCVNSRLAILSLISLEQSHPAKVQLYRNALYNAYWREGLDISQPSVLSDIQSKLQLEPISICPDAETIQSDFQKQWEYGGLDVRIPAIVDDAGRALLGLQHIDNIHGFLQGEEIHDAVPLVCEGHAKPIVGLFRSSKLSEFFLSTTHKYQVIDYQEGGLGGEHSVTNSESKAPQVLVVESTQGPLDHLINELRKFTEVSSFVPIIIVTAELTAELETSAFNLGVADVVTFEQLELGWLARLDSHIRRYQALLHLKNHASIDALTGLLNKRMLDRQFSEEWRAACRYKKSISLLVLDIDYFKNYNDLYGHSQGDDCLKQVAQALKLSVSRPKDFVARIGGEEFLILLADTDMEGAKYVATRVQKNLMSLQIEHKDSNVGKNLTMSIGVSCTFPHADRTPKDLFKFTDDLLYQAKSNGRNQFVSGTMDAPDYSK